MTIRTTGNAVVKYVDLGGEELAIRDGRAAVQQLLTVIGEDPFRDGLKDTPTRVIRALREMTEGYRMDPAKILSRVFEDRCHDMIVLENIAFTSLCEHHLMPFSGVAKVGYIPHEDTGHVVGISKLARLVECFARRLQIQERMTKQIAEAIHQHLQPLGVGVVVRANHGCMSCRGVRQSSTTMVTSSLVGVFRDPEVRSEFLRL